MDFDIPWELIVLFLFFFVLPAIGRLFQRKTEEEVEIPPRDYEAAAPDRQRAPGRHESPPPDRRAGGAEPDSLEEALRQIREALGQPAPTAERRPAPPPQRKPEPAPPDQRHAEHTRAQPEHVLAQPEHLRERYEGRREPSPEHLSAGAYRSPQAKQAALKSRLKEKPVDIGKPLEVEVLTGAPSRHAWLMEMLHDPTEARKAIKLHEILEPPASVRRLRPRKR